MTGVDLKELKRARKNYGAIWSTSLASASNRGDRIMKRLQGVVQAIGHRMVHLVDPEDSGILRSEDTGAMPDGMDFALLWKGTWHEGRCYPSFPDLTFVTYGDAERLPVRAGMLARIPEYTLETRRLLSLASDYAHELGYSTSQEPTIIGPSTAIAAGEFTEVALSLGEERPPLVIAISLHSNGDIHLLANTEPLFTTPPFDTDDAVG